MLADAFDLSLPPDAVVMTAPAGGGKTEAAIEEIVQARQFSAFGAIWVLLATGQQIHAFRTRLAARSDDGVQFGVEFFTFDRLYARLLDLHGDPQRLIDDTTRSRILRQLAAEIAARGDLDHFAPIAHLPGFIRQAAVLIDELKQGLVGPEAYSAAAATRGPKDRDLARLYAAYQQFLQENALVDDHGAGWLAVEHLEQALGPGHKPGVPFPIELLVVDGFDQFNCVHARLLAALAAHAKRAAVTLTEASGDAARRFLRFERARDLLLEAGRDVRARSLWRMTPLSPIADPVRAPALEHLVRSVFTAQPQQVPSDGALALIEAPDVGREVSAILRCVKRLLLDGAAPDSVLILTRDLARYRPALRETGRAYGLPLVVRGGLPLAHNPAIALLLSLIDLAAQDFPRRDLIDVLHSPYLDPPDLTPDVIGTLERLSQAQRIVRGRDVWLTEVRDAGRLRADEDGDSRPSALDVKDAPALTAALESFFARVTPPASGTVYDFAQWIETLVGPDPDHVEPVAEEDAPAAADAAKVPPRADCGVLVCVRSGQDAERVARDVAALAMFQRVLRGLRAAHDVIARSGAPEIMPWEDFRAALAVAVDEATVTPAGGFNRAGRVLATDVFNARGLPHDHVFIVGLSEGVFPASAPESPLYSDSEREALVRDGIALNTLAERADDMSLFYEALALARHHLTVSRFTVDDRGAPVPASPYWHALRSVLEVPAEAVERVPVGAAPTLEEAATPGEAAIALAAAWSGEHAPAEAFPAAGVHNALLADATWGARWLNALRGRALEARREDPAQPFDRYAGVLARPALIAAAAEAFGPDHVWSASQLNAYGVCPFRFFAARLLNLEALEEPEEGLDPQILGLINHRILEHTYARITDEKLPIAPEHQPRALAILEAAARVVLDDAPREFGFRVTPIWQHEQAEIVRRLAALVALDFSATAPLVVHGGQRPEAHPVAAQIGAQTRVPFWQEAPFGLRGAPALELDGEVGRVRVRGLIDRLDRAGDRVVVIDYKTGSTPHKTNDMAEGRDFQMLLYLAAARALLAQGAPQLAVTGGLFWHVRQGAVSGEIRADDPAFERGHQWLHAHILAVRAGRFPVRPSKPTDDRCVRTCEFRALCRLNRAASRKGDAPDDL